MRIRIPIFQRIKDTELLKIGVPNGDATAAVIQELARNTAKLIGLGYHVPDVRETHEGSALSDDALGWMEGIEYSSPGVLNATFDLTSTGERKKTGKLLRWVSAGLRRDFKVNGQVVVSGPYIDHVAWLGRTKPRLKNLVDLAKVDPLPDSGLMPSAVMSLPARAGMSAGVAVFSEITGQSSGDVASIMRKHGITPEVWGSQASDAEAGTKVYSAIGELRAANFSEPVKAMRTELAKMIEGPAESMTLAQFSEVYNDQELLSRVGRIMKRTGLHYHELVAEAKANGSVRG